jgi:hypothetical protein
MQNHSIIGQSGWVAHGKTTRHIPASIIERLAPSEEKIEPKHCLWNAI